MLRPADDVSGGAWIAPRLGPFGGWVGSVVPRGFAAYARVLHRVGDRRGTPVRWAGVAAATGAVLHPTAQWWKLARRTHPWANQPNLGYDEPGPDDRLAEGTHGTRRGEPREWPGGDPNQGHLDLEQLAALVAVLRAVTGDDTITAGFWEGEDWVGVPLTVARRRVPVAPRQRRLRAVPRQLPSRAHTGPDLLDAPVLELPGRRHLLLTGTLDDVVALAGATTISGRPVPGGRTPSLLWSDNRSWYVATEVDFDSTLVGGPHRLIEALLADDTLEAFEVSETDSLMIDGDQVNP